MLSLPGNGLDHVLRPSFHHDDVPHDIVLADMTKIPGTLASSAAWSTPDNPGGPALVMRRRPRDRGVVAAEATAIAAPVLVACGDNDVVPDPWAEPTAYRGARQVTVAVVPSMAHMHNFAGTRLELWDLIARWADSVVPV
jgi:pimeloyl-ACP methyl ester carboxylesterase